MPYVLWYTDHILKDSPAEKLHVYWGTLYVRKEISMADAAKIWSKEREKHGTIRRKKIKKCHNIIEFILFWYLNFFQIFEFIFRYLNLFSDIWIYFQGRHFTANKAVMLWQSPTCIVFVFFFPFFFNWKMYLEQKQKHIQHHCTWISDGVCAEQHYFKFKSFSTYV